MSTHINLLPWREELKAQQKKELFVLLGASGVASLILILFVHMGMKNAIGFQVDNNTYLKSQITILDQQIEEIKSLKKEKEKLLARMEVIQELQSNRPHIVRLFDGITRTVPEGLFLTSLTRTDTKILIEGKAESNTRVSTFMRNIEAYAWLKTPLLSLIQADDNEKDSKYIGFNLEAIQVMKEKDKDQDKDQDKDKDKEKDHGSEAQSQ